MEIIIELDYLRGDKTFQYSTEKTGTNTKTYHPAYFCSGRKDGIVYAVRVGPESELYYSGTSSKMVIRPLPGFQEEVERFVAEGRLKNEFFPFLISEGGCDGDCDRRVRES